MVLVFGQVDLPKNIVSGLRCINNSKNKSDIGIVT